MQRKKFKLQQIPIYFVLIFFALIWVFPIFITITKSFNINGLDNYKFVLTFDKINYFSVIFNSTVIAATTAVSVSILAALAGYAFSKMNFRFKNLIFSLTMGCLAVPIAAVTMPMFNTIKQLGLIDKHFGVIIPLIAFNTPMMLLMFKSYFDTIPGELIESAHIDGASSFRVFYSILMPLAVPVLANVLVLTFIYSWNDYFVPLLIIRSEDFYTVTLAAQYFVSSTFQSPSDVAHIYAVMMLLSLPSVAIYLFSQKYLQSGLVSGAIKG